MPDAKILLVDDDKSVLTAIARVLTRGGFEVEAVAEPAVALDALGGVEHDVALLDVNMPGMTGLELLQAAKERRPDLEVIMLTGDAAVPTVIAAMKAGAFDYLLKPLPSLDELLHTVSRAVERRSLRRRNRHLESLLDGKERFEDLVGQGPKMQTVFRVVEAVAPTPATVLVLGESGTGKELVARAIHRRSPRRDRPFVAVNCSALTETLLESELFGHVKGSFTGATTDRRGLFEAAHQGTLFLDEIGDMSLAAQVKLLRTLQEGEVKRIGSNEATTVDVRLVAATNVDLPAAVKAGRFREDLYYRLNVVAVNVPPLRERPEDVPLLVEHFRRRAAAKNGKDVTGVESDALQVLTTHGWPGNVRELENAIERAVVLTPTNQIRREDLPPGVGGAASVERAAADAATLPYAEAKKLAFEAFERRYLSALMRNAGGNVSKAARAAHLDRSNLRRLLREHLVEYARPEPTHDED